MELLDQIIKISFAAQLCMWFLFTTMPKQDLRVRSYSSMVAAVAACTTVLTLSVAAKAIIFFYI